ncbi:MAG: helix-turn-helix domain-containing protein [Lachnospiraceae bacterium]|nr:helix-turn-helix domain-containing protein [Lachnospiraceae bacterium]
MFDFEFLVKDMPRKEISKKIMLFYIMEGRIDFTLVDKTYSMHQNDFIILNVDREYSFRAEGEFLAACFQISYTELCELTKVRPIFLWGNTVVDNNEGCMELKRLIRKLLAEYYSARDKSSLHLMSLYYEVLNVLMTEFLLNKESAQYKEESSRFDSRKQEIIEYIRMNYNKQISLEDLAGYLFLSYAYLSKYIKKTFGMGFSDYLNQVRLEYAVSSLLNTDMPVVRIAMESGFASSAALNKAFKEKYDLTPTEYRRKFFGRKIEKDESEEDEEHIRTQLARYFSTNMGNDASSRKNLTENVTLTNLSKRVLVKNWSKLLNIGTVTDLLQSDFQSHVLMLKEDLHFEYIRIWDLYNEELFVDPNGNDYIFDKLDRVLDFLLNHGLKPYIELQPKPKIIMANQYSILQYRKNPLLSVQREPILRFMKNLMVHLLNRYNSEDVETWFFELWFSEPEEVLLQPNMSHKVMSNDRYLEQYKQIYHIIKDYLPGAKLGGGGFSLRYGEPLLKDMLEKWSKIEEKPDFISLYCYPYTPDTIERSRNQSREFSVIQNSITVLKKLMEEVSFPQVDIHVTEWNFSVSSRNSLNDHCMKGAYLMKTMIDCVDMVDIMGYWTGSDLFASYHDFKAILHGGGGLISKDGIRKPAYYAFDFMNRLGKYMRMKGDNYIITDNGAGNWRIVCHNLKTLDYKYSLMLEDEVRTSEINTLFTDLKKKRFHFDLPGKKGGKYQLRIQSVNQKHGSLQDEWIAMSAPEEVRLEDIKHLKRITTPRLVLKSVTAEEGRILFDVNMEPNEIMFIHVTYQYS